VASFIELVLKALTPLVVTLVLAWLMGKRSARARLLVGTGEAILDYSPTLRRFPMWVSVFWISLFVFLAFTVPPPTDRDTPSLVMIILVVSVPLAFMAVEMHGTSVRVSRHGIERRSPWRGRLFLLWQEVEAVSYRPSLRWFVLRAPRGVIRVQELFDGIGDFAHFVLVHLPARVTASVEGRLKHLDSLRGPDPAPPPM